MDQVEQQRIFGRELDRLVDRARGELDLTVSSIIGVLQIEQIKLYREAEDALAAEEDEEH